MFDIREVFSRLLELFLMSGAGYAMVRLQILPPVAAKRFSSLLMNVTLPATILISLYRPFDAAFLRSIVIIIGLGLLCFGLYVGISALLSRPFRVPDGRRGMWILACTISNNGAMGYPVTLALFGEEGLVLAVFLSVSFNLLACTVGPKLVCMDRGGVKGVPAVSLRTLLFSAVNLAALLGAVIYVAQLPIPSMLESPLTALSNMTTPLSMLIIGISLSSGKIRTILRDRDVFSASFLRLVLLPVLTWALLLPLPVEDPRVKGVLLIIMAMPCAAFVSILAEEYEVNVEFAAELVFLSSLLCMITIPLIPLLL